MEGCPELNFVFELLVRELGIARAENTMLTKLPVKFLHERRLDVDITEGTESFVFESIHRLLNDRVELAGDLLLYSVSYIIHKVLGVLTIALEIGSELSCSEAISSAIVTHFRFLRRKFCWRAIAGHLN